MRAGSQGVDGLRTGLADSVMREICQRLALLAKTGEPASVDLRSLPMTDADRAELEDRLGRGEVDVSLAVGGNSQIWETAFSGVWWIRHFGMGDRIASEEIAIAEVPDIVKSDPADMRAAVARLENELETADRGKKGAAG